MKKSFIFFALILLAAATPALAQKTGNTPSSVQNDVDAIKRMEQEIAAGFLKGNADANEKYASENMRFTGPGGIRLSRDAINISIRNGSLKLTSSVISDLRVIVFIDTAIATYDTDDKGTFNGIDISGKARWTDTWARINGKWTLVAVAGTPITQ